MPVPLSSKAPPYSSHRNDPHPGDNIGLKITNTQSGRSAFYAPGLGEMTPAVTAAMADADVLLVDGTFWSADEMIRLGLSAKTAADMGHLPQSGPGGMIAVLEELIGRGVRVLVTTHLEELKALLVKVRPAFVAHLEHAKHIQSSLKK